MGNKDNRLEPDETRILTRDVAGAHAIAVRILYQQSPFMLPQGWIVVGSWKKPD